ncbi:SanA/YdcF family protein [Dactylosporangium sp. CA-139066]|uniref:SanA/YdcF family protein n=1 Tax=Dactylosporangium sp. CA-139066 TaxID=3239930 RepID=UPI003D8D8020
MPKLVDPMIRAARWFAPRWPGLVRRAAMLFCVAVFLVSVGTLGAVEWLRFCARGHVFTEQDVPAAPVALVLGAQVYADASPSPFLAARLEIARRLYESGKVRAILVSGDNSRHEYDEPSAMRQWLIDHGVPPVKIVRDYAGFDTYDSCARAVRVFGVTRAIVVTQAYHIPRAVALCRRLGLDADGVGDHTMSQFHKPWITGEVREFGAADKAAYDVVSGRDPIYLGQHETGVEEALRAG